jgi:hypothetical protein
MQLLLLLLLTPPPLQPPPQWRHHWMMRMMRLPGRRMALWDRVTPKSIIDRQGV